MGEGGCLLSVMALPLASGRRSDWARVGEASGCRRSRSDYSEILEEDPVWSLFSVVLANPTFSRPLWPRWLKGSTDKCTRTLKPPPESTVPRPHSFNKQRPIVVLLWYASRAPGWWARNLVLIACACLVQGCKPVRTYQTSCPNREPNCRPRTA